MHLEVIRSSGGGLCGFPSSGFSAAYRIISAYVTGSAAAVDTASRHEIFLLR
jgi:hypothetical protein